MAKSKICRKCGREIPEGLKVCPACGGKAKLPVALRILRVIAIIIAVFLVLDFFLSDPDYVPEEEREYTEVTVDQLYEELDDNALKAEDTYQNSYVAVRGTLGTIDSDGSYIGLDPLSGPSLENIHCRITSDEQRDAIKAHSRGDEIVIKGQMVDIGEIAGYTMNIDSIE